MQARRKRKPPHQGAHEKVDTLINTHPQAQEEETGAEQGQGADTVLIHVLSLHLVLVAAIPGHRAGSAKGVKVKSKPATGAR